MPWNREPFIFAYLLPPNTVQKNCACEWKHLEDIRPLECMQQFFVLPPILMHGNIGGDVASLCIQLFLQVAMFRK